MEIAKEPQRAMNTLLLGLLGIAVTLMGELLLSASVTFSFLLAMAGLFLTGFLLRVLRRKLFFGSRHTLHQALSFDALMQGSIVLNPQLLYPDVEQAFICRQAGMLPSSILGWFFIRPSSALAIPAALAGTIALLAGYLLLGLVGWAVAIAAVVLRSFAFAREYDGEVPTWRFALAVVAGLLAALGEGVWFVAAAQLLGVNAESWQLFALYAITLTVFELSPVPLGLGVIELSAVCIIYLLSLPVAAVALPLAYRLFRAVPIIILSLFYLPRYKLSLLDLYNPDLFLALGQTWHRQEIQEAHGPLLSIVIPAYNEEQRLPLYLPRVVEYCRSAPYTAEVLVVDDGSSDATAAYVETLAHEYSFVHLVKQPMNRGKGAAVRRGVLEAKGAYILFADADGATPIEEATNLLAMAQRGGDVIIASRQLDSSRTNRSFFRGLLGTVFYRLTNLLAIPGVSDTQCGFKLFTGVAARRLFPLLQEEGYAFDVELLYLAQKLGMSIVEVSVNWTSVEGSKVHPIRDALKMLQALHRIRHRWAGLHLPP